LHALSERLDEARPSFAKALALLPETATRERAMVLAALADLAGRQGRVEESLALVAQAEQLVPDHPALARIRGDALAQVWRWKDAIAPLAEAAAGAPKDDLRWDELATALGSAGEDTASLDAAVKGLALQPRDADLLRCQSLSLDHMKMANAPDALAAYLERRPLDEAPRLKNMCQMKVPGCALERNPVHVHEMKATTP
jgi:predicted Zn-dependent protease